MDNASSWLLGLIVVEVEGYVYGCKEVGKGVGKGIMGKVGKSVVIWGDNVGGSSIGKGVGEYVDHNQISSVGKGVTGIVGYVVAVVVGIGGVDSFGKETMGVSVSRGGAVSPSDGTSYTVSQSKTANVESNSMSNTVVSENSSHGSR